MLHPLWNLAQIVGPQKILIFRGVVVFQLPRTSSYVVRHFSGRALERFLSDKNFDRVAKLNHKRAGSSELDYGESCNTDQDPWYPVDLEA